MATIVDANGRVIRSDGEPGFLQMAPYRPLTAEQVAAAFNPLENAKVQLAWGLNYVAGKYRRPWDAWGVEGNAASSSTSA